MCKYDWSNIGACCVFYFDGLEKKYACLEDAVCAVGWRRIDDLDGRDFGIHLDAVVKARVWGSTRDELVFLDHLGFVIPLAIVRRVAMEQGLHIVDTFLDRRWPRRDRWVHSHAFRDGPVPHTRCRTAGQRHGRPPVSMTQEISANATLGYDDEMVELGIRFRACRRAKYLPSWWNDHSRSRHVNRNWKNYRARQWKER